MSRIINENAEDSDCSNESEATRPNRWKGVASTWQSLTAQERGLAASLDQIRDADLSVHLYNAHALKRRALELENAGQTSGKGKEKASKIPEEDQSFTPPKSWTAWPLPPDQVPREGEITGPDDPNNAYTFKRKEKTRPSRMLEEVLIGTTLKIAKDQFQDRQAASETDEGFSSSVDDVKSIKHRLRTTDITDDSDGMEVNSTISIYDSSTPHPNNRSTKHSNQGLISVISADDEHSANILRPSIRRALSKLDQVLIALHHARENCNRYSQLEADANEIKSVTSIVTDGPSPALKRPRGRPRKFANLTDRSRDSSSHAQDTSDAGELLRAKKTNLGRPLKAYKRLDGETQEDYLIRIARIQKKPLPSFAPLRTASPSPASLPESRKKSPQKRATESEITASRQKKLALRDWSEVIGSAALVGFSPNVINRATQRCANLFGEGMAIRAMVEMPFLGNPAETVINYAPQAVQDFGIDFTEISTDDTETSVSSSAELKRKRNCRSENGNRVPRKVPRHQNVFCSIDGCLRMTTGFRDNSSLKRHLQTSHQISRNNLADYLLSSDEEMDGAVHVDGFLKPLKRFQGGSRSKYKKEGGGNRGVKNKSDEDVIESSGLSSDSESAIALETLEDSDIGSSSNSARS